ncbi:hypothetical protein, partial [Mesomycoplasma ovipneumoniae]|uniref:hypothetical protein n=1 Tax=Mesomycoplasma ovipneumoniae TaxID=29562 RepID=UPI003119C9FB
GKPTGPEILLYPNDKITGDTGAIKLKLAPYTQRESESGADVIRYIPPTVFERIKDEAFDIYNSFWRSVEGLTSGTTRGKEGTRPYIDAVKLTPQPGFDVTLISGQKVNFSWNEPVSRTFSITDSTGRKVFEKNVSGLTSIELDLD